MKLFNIFALLILSLSFFSFAADAQTTKKKKATKRTKTPAVKSTPKTPVDTSKPDQKILVEGFQSKVETPFIFIARDVETYALMRELVEGLPASSTINFDKTAVIAAFAGTRNTGGWSVSVKQLGDRASIQLNAPPKGSMTAQMITYPFQVATVAVDANQALQITAAAEWLNQVKTYQVTKGGFVSSGGIMGQSKKFNIEGSIGVLTFGDHLTYLFALSGKGSGSGRGLLEMASGVMKESGLEIARLDAGSFAETPHPPVKVTGTATDKKLTLTFDSLPLTIADGYMARGTLEAVRK